MAPRLPVTGLLALRAALANDDPRLLQQVTTDLPPLRRLHDACIGGACALGFCGWKGLRLRRLGEVLAFFDSVCAAADLALDEIGAARAFLDWYDETPRRLMRSRLLAEVEDELLARRLQAA